MGDIEGHQKANQSYIEDGIRLLNLAQSAPVLFANQSAGEKRKMLDFVLSNCRWKDGQLAADFRKPFDVLAVAVAADQQPVWAVSQQTGNFENWHPKLDTSRTA